jgi:ribosomal protein S18 acetylase RimI-like enzyme
MDNLKIKEGISNNQIDQLVKFANEDEQIVKLTSDFRRFRTREMADQWFTEVKPQVYVLEDQNQNLKGIIWFDDLPILKDEYTVNFDITEYQLTFAIRLYDDARGKGLAKNFFEECLRRLKESDYYKKLECKGLWLTTKPENIGAIALYEKLGFIHVNTPEKIGRVLMILK